MEYRPGYRVLSLGPPAGTNLEVNCLWLTPIITLTYRL